MAPRKTSDGRDVPRLLGARQRTMSLLALVFEDEARREVAAKRRRDAVSRSRAGFVIAAAMGCGLAALAGGVLAWALQTPELDRVEVLLAQGDIAALDDALGALDDDSPRARSARALARAQQAVWGAAPLAEATLALRDGDGPHAALAEALVSGMKGEVSGSADAWAQGIAAGRSLELAEIERATAALTDVQPRPRGATRTLAALQFCRGDVSAALATLEGAEGAAAASDARFYAAWMRPSAEGQGGVAEVPGRAALLRAHRCVLRGDDEGAKAALADARDDLLRWDPVAIVAGLRLGFLAGDADGLRAWSEDASFSARVRGLARAYAHAASGDWVAAEAELQAEDPDAPWVAYVLGHAAAERGRWSDAVRLAAVARRGMPGRAELDVLGAWVATHVLDASGAHDRLVALGEQAPWAPRVWTARAQAAEAIGRPAAEVLPLYERALEEEHRPAGAAAALAAHASGEEALHLSTMAVEFEPSEPRHRQALALAQVDRGRLAEAWLNLEPLQDGDAEVWLTRVELAFARRTETLDPRVEGWIERAAAAQADPAAVERLRLRARFARGASLGPEARVLAQHQPDDGEAIALAIRALARDGKLPAARRLAERTRRRLPRVFGARATLALASALREHGEIREAAQLAFKGWSGLPDSAPALQTLVAAAEAVEIWLELGNTSGARAIARDLTDRLPHSPDAWVLRARVQLAAQAVDYACRSLGQARALDPNALRGEDIAPGCATPANR